MLDLASISRGYIGINAYGNQKIGEHSMSIVDLLCRIFAGFGEGNVAIFVNSDISAVLQYTPCSANTRLGKSHMLAYVNRTDVRALFGKY